MTLLLSLDPLSLSVPLSFSFTLLPNCVLIYTVFSLLFSSLSILLYTAPHSPLTLSFAASGGIHISIQRTYIYILHGI